MKTWDELREEILKRSKPPSWRTNAAEMEAMRLAALVVVKEYKLIQYRKPEAPKVSG